MKTSYRRPRIIRCPRYPDVWPYRIMAGRPVYRAQDSEWLFYLMWLRGY